MKKYNLDYFTKQLDRFDKKPDKECESLGDMTSIARSVRFIAKIHQNSVYEATKSTCQYLANKEDGQKI